MRSTCSCTYFRILPCYSCTLELGTTRQTHCRQYSRQVDKTSPPSHPKDKTAIGYPSGVSRLEQNACDRVIKLRVCVQHICAHASTQFHQIPVQWSWEPRHAQQRWVCGSTGYTKHKHCNGRLKTLQLQTTLSDFSLPGSTGSAA